MPKYPLGMSRMEPWGTKPKNDNILASGREKTVLRTSKEKLNWCNEEEESLHQIALVSSNPCMIMRMDINAIFKCLGRHGETNPRSQSS
mmetsp:Transcript_12600/g.26647  ORF Transcript_12600/g.26647 Transcript_12600/m.26647 type:complete len:89 (+) Transcript_12600:43-309(+)